MTVADTVCVPTAHLTWFGEEYITGSCQVCPVTDSELGTVNPKSMYDPSDPYANRDPRFYASIYYNGSDFCESQK
mgnify:FL=1